MVKEKEKILIKAGTMINRGLHEDDDYLIALEDLNAIVIEYLPGAIQVVIPQLNQEFAEKFNSEFLPPLKIFYIHKTN